ncbi:MAG: RluA family pseudouridine synthase [Clostridia bacterium]|nr:RluA family pseudouridine synthase [Clostridia bacterium]
MEELTILYEDNQIVVVIKPQNVPTQADDSNDKDMLSMVKDYIKQKYNKPGEAFIGLVHRLDRPTGGIMVFARNSKAANRLTEQFKTHSVEKVYYAIANGVVKVRTQRLVNYLKKDTKENIVKIVPMSEAGAKKAELVYNYLEDNGKQSLLEVKILTGRSHQIRLQLANIGHSLVGDVKYGKEKGMTSKLGLWAGKLAFDHPTTKERMVFMACPDQNVLPWKNFRMEKYLTR